MARYKYRCFWRLLGSWTESQRVISCRSIDIEVFVTKMIDKGCKINSLVEFNIKWISDSWMYLYKYSYGVMILMKKFISRSVNFNSLTFFIF
jgi:hypothetical protein